MALHAYVDESKKAGYIVAAAVVTADEVAAARRAMRALLLPKQLRLHFRYEKDSRKAQIVDATMEVSVEARLYVCRTRRSARENCLNAMVPDLADRGVDRLVLERDTSTERLDRQVLFEATRKAGTEMTYQHDMPHQEPLLWAPDAIAWCWAAGGSWRQRIAEHVTVMEAG